MTRQQVVDELEKLLKSISTTNNYQTDFDDVRVWDDLPSEYGHNEIIFKDTKEKYEKKNVEYKNTLRVEIIAVVLEQSGKPASKLGTIALSDLKQAVKKMSVCGAVTTLITSDKWVSTKGRTACEVELHIDVKYYDRA